MPICLLVGCGQKKNQSEEPRRSEESRRIEAEVRKPRIWRSERLGIEVTIPTDTWVEKANPNVIAEFSTAVLVAMVADARPGASDSEWKTAVSSARLMRVGPGMKVDKPTETAEERTGRNSNGHEYWLYVTNVLDGPKSYLLGVSVTRVKDKAVLTMFEGRLQSDSDRAATERLHAIQFLSSVK